MEDGELRITEFGRRLLRGRVESLPLGCSLILSSSAPLLKVGVYLWRFTAICGLYFVLQGAVLGGLSLQSVVESFFFCSLVGSLVLPALWGRRWKFRRIAAVLSQRLKAKNDAELQAVSQDSNLAGLLLVLLVWTSPIVTLLRDCLPVVYDDSVLVTGAVIELILLHRAKLSKIKTNFFERQPAWNRGFLPSLRNMKSVLKSGFQNRREGRRNLSVRDSCETTLQRGTASL